MTFDVGETIGDYQILGMLGRGGMAAVYKVRNTLTDREEAMKVVLPAAEASPEMVDRFLREIRIQAKLEHPYIAQIRTAFRSGESVLMIMEMVQGVTLEAKLSEGALPLGEAFRITDDILSALSHAHSRGIVHRDIKPSNIMVTPRGAPKLTDFGIATAAGDARITRSGVAIGSRAYMSPEQVSSHSRDERSDIYSLGVTAYEMLTGKRPFRRHSDYSLMDAHLKEVPVSPSLIARLVPQGVSMVVLKALEKAPEDRYQTAADFQKAWRGAFFGADDSTLPSPHGAVRENLPSESPKLAPIDAQTLEVARKALATVLGPIAGIIVPRTAKRVKTADQLRNALAAEIPDEKERKAFLAAFPRQ